MHLKICDITGRIVELTEFEKSLSEEDYFLYLEFKSYIEFNGIKKDKLSCFCYNYYNELNNNRGKI